MIEVPDRLVAEGPRLEMDIVLPDGVDDLEVEIFRSGAGGCAGEPFGRWTFERPGAGGRLLAIDWLDEGDRAVTLAAPGTNPMEARSAERNPEAVVYPAMTVRLAGGGYSAEAQVKVADTRLLVGYYQRESHQEEYVVEHPFFNAFHEGRLRGLGRVFRRYIRPGSRVLDVGSGYGIFYMIDSNWDIELVCCDLDRAAMEKMRALAPHWEWVVADALKLPWEDASFDAVYAGEIIEHVPDPAQALSEWGRVLRPGGVLVLSTPNRDRLLARANHEAMPVHHEHIREMNLAEARAAARAGGFNVLETGGVYVEFLINWWRPGGRRVDLLTARLGHPRYRFLYRLAMEMGRVVPSIAFDLVLVCRKQ